MGNSDISTMDHQLIFKQNSVLIYVLKHSTTFYGTTKDPK